MRALAREMAAPWPGLQLQEGTFPDYLHGDKPPRSTRYGEAVLGYALIQTGLREQDEAMVDAGLRALTWFVGRRDLQRDHPSVFANAFVATAYNFARRRLDDHPRFADARPAWERWLRRVTLLWLPDTRRYGNKYLVEVLAVFELLRSGLESKEPGSVLADRDRSRRRAERLLNLRIPRMAEREQFPIAGENAFVLSDPSAGSPLAYHGLSLGMYARGLDLLGAQATTAARRTLRKVAHCSQTLAAPDGDLAYFGRSQEQGWSLALTTYGALSAASLSGRDEAARARVLAGHAVRRLSTQHGVGPKGFFITPSLRPDYRGTKGLDSYAAAIGYSGLTLAALNWAVDRFGDGDPAQTPDGVEEAGATRTRVNVFRTVNPRYGFAVARGRYWYVVKPAASSRADDLRYDFGLVALKASDGAGDWRDVVRVRPHTKVGPDSAGPLLRRSRGVGLPEAESVSVASDGTLTLEGGFRTAAGTWLRRGVRFRFQPLDSGVRLIFPTEAGDRIKYSVFFREGDRLPRVEADRVFDDEQLVTFNPDAAVAFDSARYASGTDGRLVRANILFPASTGEPVRITVGPA
jgi:hypothetical protein